MSSATGDSAARDGLDSASRQLLVLLCGLTPLAVLPGNYDPANLPQTTLVELGALALLVLWSAAGARRGAFRLASSPLLVPLWALLGWAALSLTWGENRYEGAVTLLHWAACGSIFVIASNLLRDERTLARLSTALFGAATLVAMLGVIQHLFRVEWVPQAFPPAATFANKNMAAQFVVMALPFGLAMASGAIRAALIGTGLPLMLAYLVFAHARAAWIALAISGLVVTGALFRSWSRARLALLLVAVLVVATVLGWVVGIPAEVGAALDDVPETGEAVSVLSLQFRIAVARNTLAMIRDSPWLGVGLGNFPVHYPAYARRVVEDPLWGDRLELAHAHDDYLQLGAELGIPGLALALWLLWRLGRTFVAARPGLSTLRARGVTAAAGCLAAGLTLGAFSFPAHRALPPLLAAIAGAVVAASRREGSPSEDTITLALPGRMRLAVPVAAGLALVATSVVTGRWIASDRHCNRMRAAEKREDWARAASEAARARQLNPWRHEPALTLGTAALIGGEFARAIAELETALKMRPRDVTILANLGQAYEQSGQRREALDRYGRLVALRPSEAGIHHRMGQLQAASGDPEAALDSFRLAVRYRPDAASFQLRLGLAAMQRRLYPEAERALARAVELEPSLANAHKALGVIQLDRGRTAEAVERFRTALSLSPDDKDAAQMRRVIDAFESGTRER